MKNQSTTYTTGELAKKANVTVRTIHFYDQVGLLKPSYTNPMGYRTYTQEDYFKLQKILCLKSLGFELGDIKTMTATQSYTTMAQAIRYQQRAIATQINNLTLLKSNLEDIATGLAQHQSIDWPQIMHSIQMNSLSNTIIEQYRNSTNIDIRIKLHTKYSTNKESWFRWLYSQYALTDADTVLEVGCGDGALWRENSDRLKGRLTLTDISPGMVEDAKESLGTRRFTYAVADAHSLPFEDGAFTKVIANHTMFYLKNIDAALTQIKRILTPDGTFYSTTYGSLHMHEITDLVKEFNPKINLSNVALYEQFGLENGEKILTTHFGSVRRLDYNGALLVTDPEDLLNYILSCHGNQNEYIKDHIPAFRSLVESKFKDGAFRITKQACLFLASGGGSNSHS